MSKHTKGPWRVDRTKALGAYGVWTDYATHPGWDGKGYGSQICSMKPNEESEITREQRDANASLIASAPELLAGIKELREALRRVLTGSAEHGNAPDDYECSGRMVIQIGVLRAIDRLVAKAEGRS